MLENVAFSFVDCTRYKVCHLTMGFTITTLITAIIMEKGKKLKLERQADNDTMVTITIAPKNIR